MENATIKKPVLRTLFNGLVILSLAGLLIGLFAYGYMGSFIRIVGDDYCYGGVLNKYGFFNAQIQAYANKMPFHGNRYTLNFISMFLSLFPPVINGYIPFLTIIYFGFAIYYLLSRITIRINLSAPKVFLLILSLLIVFFSILTAPTVKQSLYFRSAMLPSFLPIISSLILMALILHVDTHRWYFGLLVFVFSFLNAGLSENGASFQGVLMGILVICGFWMTNKNIENGKTTTYLSLTAIIATIIAGIAMWLSPSIAEVQEQMNLSIVGTLSLSFRHTVDFFLGTIRSQILVAGILIFAGLIVFMLCNVNKRFVKTFFSIKTRSWLLATLLHQIISFLLIFSIMVPSAFTRNVYPDPRHLIGGSLVMVMNLLISGFFLGGLFCLGLNYFRIQIKPELLLIFSFLLLLISLAYPVRYFPQITKDRILFQYWSIQWNQRHQEIIEAAAAGYTEVHVMELDHIIEEVGELGPDPNINWYNQCAAQYYGLTIFADQSGWEEEFVIFQQKITGE